MPGPTNQNAGGGNGSDVVGGDDGAGNGSDPNGGVNPALVVTDGDHVLGDADAPVTVIEYGDFQCPRCRDFALNTFPTIQRIYIDTGDVRWVYRHFPLRSIHEFAEAAAQASECAGEQGRFFEYHDLLYENQPEFELENLTGYADDLGLNVNAFESCLTGSFFSGEVAADLVSGLSLGVAGTPTFFINGQGYSGASNVDQFSALLDAALAEAQPDGDFPFGGDSFP